MKITKIEVRNVLGVEELDIEAGGHITIVEGPNGTGKTSILRAITGALGGGKVGELVRNGAERAEVVIVLDDETRIKKTIAREGSPKTEARRPDGTKGGQAFIASLVDSAALNPVEFLTASEDQRVRMFLEAIPFTVKAEESRELFAVEIPMQDRAHGFEVLARIEEHLREQRKEANRTAREKGETAKGIRANLPEDFGEDFASLARSLLSELDTAKRKLAEAVAESQREAGAAMDRAKEERDEIIASINADLEEKIAKLRRESQAAIDHEHRAAQEAINEASEAHTARCDAARERFDPAIATLTAKHAEANTKALAAAQNEGNAKLAARLEREADDAKAAAAVYETRLERLAAKRADAAKAIAIPGLEVSAGRLYVGGVPFETLNEAARVKVAIAVAKLRAKGLPVICCDGLERLDPATFAAFEAEAMAQNEFQFFVSRVTNDPKARGLKVTAK